MIYYGKTDKGITRSENQDTFIFRELSLKCVDGKVLLAAVCDGMGGEAAGNIASDIACESFVKYVTRQIKAFDEDVSNPDNTPFEKLLCDGVKYANNEVLSTAEGNDEYSGMGTTLVGVLVLESRIYAVSIGDSRLYAMYGKELRQISHDHSYVQSLVDSGAITEKAARNHPGKNIILRAIGADEEAEPEAYIPEEYPDALLLCSDGLYNMVSEDEISGILSDTFELGDAVDKLVDRANDAGGTDNITVFAVRL